MPIIKAMVNSGANPTSSSNLGVDVTFFDVTNDFVLQDFVALNDISTFSSFALADIRAAFETTILNYAATQGYSMTAADIIWGFPNILSASQYTALTQSKSFSAASRSLNSAFQISSTRDSLVSYAVDIAATLSLTSGQSGNVILEYADNSGMTTNVVTVNSCINGNTGTLAIGLNLTQTATATVSGMIPAGKFVRIRTANITGTPTFTYRTGQEVLV